MLGNLVLLPFCILGAFAGRKEPFGLNQCVKECCGVDDCAKSYCDAPLDGHSKKEVFLYNREKSERVFQQDCERLGVDINTEEGRQQLFVSKASDVVTHLGHAYLVFQTPVSKSTKYIFVPNRDWEQHETGSTFNQETGLALSTEVAHKNMLTKCRTYNPSTPLSYSTFPSFSAAVQTQPRADTRDDLTAEELEQAARDYARGVPNPALEYHNETAPLLGEQ